METSSSIGRSDENAYEFTDAQNEVIASTGFWIGTWGVFTLIAGGMNLIGGVVSVAQGELAAVVAGIIFGLVALIPLLVGVEFLRTGRSLGAVVGTEGNDIDHLMDAMRSVGAAFRILIVAVVSWIAILIVVMAVFVETRVR
jgi:hypothetical protein